MGDIEAPESNRPRQTVLLSILPSKEFATSRKGMLLLAEVPLTPPFLTVFVTRILLSMHHYCATALHFFLRLLIINTRFMFVGVSSGVFVGEGFSVTVSKPVEINIVFLQLGRLTGSEPGAVLSFVSFVCFTASTAAAFVTVPLLEFLAALCLLFAYSTKFNERFKGFRWPLMDFLRCVTASIIYFIVSIVAVSRYVDGSSKAAGIFGFIATIVFALDFYLIFNELATFLKEGGQTDAQPSRQRDDFSDSDSD